MRDLGGNILFSASDLMRFMGCAHATTLDLMHLRGEGPVPGEDSEDSELLQKQGDAHESAHLSRLKGSGRSVVELTRSDLASAAGATLAALADVLEALCPLLLKHGKPEYIRSDNGPEFVATSLQDWLVKVGITPLHIYPGSPWEGGYNERFNGTLRREVLNAEWFTTIKQAQIVIDLWLKQHNHTRPHQALQMHPPVPQTLLEKPTISGPGIGG